MEETGCLRISVMSPRGRPRWAEKRVQSRASGINPEAKGGDMYRFFLALPSETGQSQKQCPVSSKRKNEGRYVRLSKIVKAGLEYPLFCQKAAASEGKMEKGMKLAHWSLIRAGGKSEESQAEGVFS